MKEVKKTERIAPLAALAGMVCGCGSDRGAFDALTGARCAASAKRFTKLGIVKAKQEKWL